MSFNYDVSSSDHMQILTKYILLILSAKTFNIMRHHDNTISLTQKVPNKKGCIDCKRLKDALNILRPINNVSNCILQKSVLLSNEGQHKSGTKTVFIS